MGRLEQRCDCEPPRNGTGEGDARRFDRVRWTEDAGALDTTLAGAGIRRSEREAERSRQIVFGERPVTPAAIVDRRRRHFPNLPAVQGHFLGIELAEPAPSIPSRFRHRCFRGPPLETSTVNVRCGSA